MNKVSLPSLFPLATQITNFVINFKIYLGSSPNKAMALTLSVTGRKRGEDGNTKI